MRFSASWRRAVILFPEDWRSWDGDKSFGYALLVMHNNGFRHLPVVENGKTVGIVSARNALDPDLEEFVSESRRREQILREAT